MTSNNRSFSKVMPVTKKVIQRPQRPRVSPASQRGIALYVVIVFVMLSMLLALWAARNALFNEMVIGNDADYRRTFEAAQAMLQDAEFDIRGVRPDGTFCTPSQDTGKGDVCRYKTSVYFDIETSELDGLLSTIQNQSPTTKCYKGICAKRAGVQDFWNDANLLTAMMQPDVGARYGQFTGADATSSANPILASRDGTRTGAWYWVEIMPYIDPNLALIQGLPPDASVLRFAPSQKKPIVFRITALARGNKPNSEVVLQSTLSIKTAE